MNYYPESVKQEAVVMYARGESVKKIMDSFGVSRQTVYLWLDKYKITKRGRSNLALPKQVTKKTVIARFLEKVNRATGHYPEHAFGECWEWEGCKIPLGYGRFWDGERVVYAHRFSWGYHNRKSIPEGYVVMHKCDNMSCVRPGHLTIGTRSENVLDSVLKGRWGGFQHKGIQK